MRFDLMSGPWRYVFSFVIYVIHLYTWKDYLTHGFNLDYTLESLVDLQKVIIHKACIQIFWKKFSGAGPETEYLRGGLCVGNFYKLHR